jgi:Pectinacetylesterase
MIRALLVAMMALLVAGCAGGDDDETKPAAAPVASGGWVRAEPGGKTRCARGGPYAFWTREGDPKKLVIFFEGGGGCFSEETCVEGSPWFDDDVGPDDDPRVAGGMMDLADTSNPFRDWSWVFVPSCTGDVHVGDARVDYGSVVVEQRGWQNARAALERTFRDFPDVEQVLVTGCSAGSVGSAWHVDEVVRRYPAAQVTQVGDSLAYIFHRPIRLTGWGTNKHLPPFFRVGNRRWTMEEFVTRLTRAHPDVTFARFNYAADQVQASFYEAVGGRPADFEGRLRAVEERLKRLPNYRSYLACGTLHCAFPSPEFSTLRVKGVTLRDWVHDLAEGRDVACPTCSG